MRYILPIFLILFSCNSKVEPPSNDVIENMRKDLYDYDCAFLEKDGTCFFSDSSIGFDEDRGEIVIKIVDRIMSELKPYQIDTKEVALAKVRSENYIDDVFEQVYRVNAWEYACRIHIYTTNPDKPSFNGFVEARKH